MAHAKTDKSGAADTAPVCIVEQLDAVASGLGLPIVATAAALSSGVNFMICAPPNMGKSLILSAAEHALFEVGLNVLIGYDRWTRSTFKNEEFRQQVASEGHLIGTIDDWSTIAGDKHQLTNLADVFIKLSDTKKTGDAMTELWKIEVQFAGFAYGVQPKWFAKLRGSKGKGTDSPIRELWDSHFRQKVVRYWVLPRKPIKATVHDMDEFSKWAAQAMKACYRSFAPDGLAQVKRSKQYKQLVKACKSQLGKIRGEITAGKLALGMLRFMGIKDAKKYIKELAVRIWIERQILKLFEHGVTIHWGEYYVTAFAMRYKHGVTKDDIKDETGMSMDTIEDWIKGAERLGWIERKGKLNSRPRIYVVPSKSMKDTLRKGVPLK